MEINYLAVLLAAVASMVIGAFWFSPLLFGNLWMKEMKITAKDAEEMKKKGMAIPYLKNFLAMLIFSYVLALFVGDLRVINGLEVAGWIWLGFIVTIQYGNTIWGRESLTLFAVHSGYWLVNILAMAAIIAAM